MNADQPVLDLFEPEPDEPVYMIPVCNVCGMEGPPVEIDGGPSAPWREAEMWGYLSLQEHLRFAHPEELNPEGLTP